MIGVFYYIGWNKGFDDSRKQHKKHMEAMKKMYEKHIDIAEKIAFKRGVLVGKSSLRNKKVVDEIERHRLH